MAPKGAGDRLERVKDAYKYDVLDFILKSDDSYEDDRYEQEFKRVLNKAVKIARLQKAYEDKLLKSARIKDENLYEHNQLGQLVGCSCVMRSLYTVIKTFAVSTLSILLTGETGVGKSIIARTIHDESERRNKPFEHFVPMEFPETLQESELFGIKKGTATGIHEDKIGLIKKAEYGTLFIDEIAEMRLNDQVKLLRFLDTSEIRPIGGDNQVVNEVRIISATNKNLEDMIREEQFRSDLYFRLNILKIEIPPLREHSEDIPLLVAKFIKESALVREQKIEISQRALKKLRRYSWPGNIRELSHTIERALVYAMMESTNEIQPDHIEFTDESKHKGNNPNNLDKLVDINSLYHSMANREVIYKNIKEFKDIWGLKISKAVIEMALEETLSITKAGEHLGLIDNKKDKKYEAYRQYVHKMGLKAGDYRSCFKRLGSKKSEKL